MRHVFFALLLLSALPAFAQRETPRTVRAPLNSSAFESPAPAEPTSPAAGAPTDVQRSSQSGNQRARSLQELQADTIRQHQHRDQFIDQSRQMDGQLSEAASIYVEHAVAKLRENGIKLAELRASDSPLFGGSYLRNDMGVLARRGGHFAIKPLGLESRVAINGVMHWDNESSDCSYSLVVRASDFQSSEMKAEYTCQAFLAGKFQQRFDEIVFASVRQEFERRH